MIKNSCFINDMKNERFLVVNGHGLYCKRSTMRQSVPSRKLIIVPVTLGQQEMMKTLATGEARIFHWVAMPTEILRT